MAAALIGTVSAASGAAQGVLSGAPNPRVGVGIAAWQVLRVAQNIERTSRVIYARNDTTVPVAVTGVNLTGCVNLRVTCGPLKPEFVVIAPGGIEPVAEIFPSSQDEQFSFTFGVQWRAATECVDPRGDSAGTLPSIPPEPMAVVMPPFGLSTGHSTDPVTIRFFVSSRGDVDSTAVTGISNQRDRVRLQQAMQRFRFRAGRLGRCPVASSTSITMTLSSH